MCGGGEREGGDTVRGRVHRRDTNERKYIKRKKQSRESEEDLRMVAPPIYLYFQIFVAPETYDGYRRQTWLV